MVLIKATSLDLFSFFSRVNCDSVWGKKSICCRLRSSQKAVVNPNPVIYVEFSKLVKLRYVYLSYI